MKPDVQVENALHMYRIPREVYKRLPRHNLVNGCSGGKMYPLPSNPDDYAVCLKCGVHVNNDILRKYGVTVPKDVPVLREMRVTW